MTASVASNPQDVADRFFTMVKSLEKFDEIEIRSVINTLLSPTEREKCFIATYRRTVANVASLLELKSAKHFQAIAMLARALFELAVDIRLIDVLPQSCEKMVAFVDVEKLRCALKVQQFKASHQGSGVDTSNYDSFVSTRRASVEAAMKALWPGMTKVTHWSGRVLSERVKLLKPPFEQIYEVLYPSLSWQVHSGLTGVVNLKAETFTFICGKGFELSGDSYSEILSAMIDEFKIETANRTVRGKMKAAKLLPFTDTAEEAEAVRLALM
jgi:hypothetical protein